MLRRLGGSLFVKIYLTLLASLAVVAIASGLFFHIGRHEEELGWSDRRDTFLQAILPSEVDGEQLQGTIERLGNAFDADIGVFAPDGRVLAVVGRPPPPDMERNRRGPRGMRAFVTRLPDGRVVTARIRGPIGPAGRNPLVYLAVIAAAIGLAAYPVVRHLTRRLEGLRKGVEHWGEGNLLVRVPVRGHDEVAAVAASFNAAAERIERLMTAHRALLANASHELRSPLARLRMATELFEKAPSEAARDEIVRNLSEIDSLVEEILLASRLDHVEAPDQRETLDLLALAAEEGARNGVAVAGEPAMVAGDARLLARLIRNLMQNALRHGAPPVEAKVSARDGRVELRMRDHGPGIAAADAARIFEPFYRPAGRGEQAGGWGLGLSLVRQIAERHGGGVRHETPDGGGTEFVVDLPAAG